jgi:hypothetical protein
VSSTIGTEAYRRERFEQVPCEECGEPLTRYIPVKEAPLRRYCGPRCSSTAMQRSKRAWEVGKQQGLYYHRCSKRGISAMTTAQIVDFGGCPFCGSPPPEGLERTIPCRYCSAYRTGEEAMARHLLQNHPGRLRGEPEEED